MASKGIGKIFEEEIKKSFPEDFYIERYKDDTAGFYGVGNPADNGLARAVLHKGIYGGFIINFRELEETYYITVQDMIRYINSTERKSIPVEWCRENGVRIEQTKKRVRYSYDLRCWLERYFGGAV